MDNKRALELLEEWYSTPDDRGDEYWDELLKEVDPTANAVASLTLIESIFGVKRDDPGNCGGRGGSQCECGGGKC